MDEVIAYVIDRIDRLKQDAITQDYARGSILATVAELESLLVKITESVGKSTDQRGGDVFTSWSRKLSTVSVDGYLGTGDLGWMSIVTYTNRNVGNLLLWKFRPL